MSIIVAIVCLLVGLPIAGLMAGILVVNYRHQAKTRRR